VSTWAIFTVGFERHKAPLDWRGNLSPPHELSMDCVCGPSRDNDADGELWVHHDSQTPDLPLIP
jgi:hypothetical protein